ncbi:hypothetical protein RFI_30477 [Reticulomyxa filosa]|uniref:Protein kinase domain-containing protein n=1 Tax=Reticulomyxa filosa TaxID=46433 RepID=X6M015_RETFI|nr:hypothetical protein RFI_30477 [Reticulomyxa filosa]|eukprot:ETO06916.1 hypothetical protein RFI_30477 [Reticulomyxa filosa]
MYPNSYFMSANNGYGGPSGYYNLSPLDYAKTVRMANALVDPHLQDATGPKRKIPSDLHELKETVEITSNELLFDVEIGRGAYGTVYKARWCGHEVACKKFAKEDIDSVKAMQFLKELQTSTEAFIHPNIIRYYGFCQTPFCLVMEYMEGGSVQEYLRHDKPQSIQISPLQRIMIARQAALGINHLHKHNIVHRDIAARNLLMDDPKSNKDFRVVVSDFCMSRILHEEPYSATYTTVGPLKWMAPEALNEQKFTTKSDVYSFGITLWELLTGQEPYADVDPVNTAVEVLVSKKRPKLYGTIHSKLQKLMKHCWDEDPAARPDFPEIIQILDNFIEKAAKQQKKRRNSSESDNDD